VLATTHRPVTVWQLPGLLHTLVAAERGGSGIAQGPALLHGKREIWRAEATSSASVICNLRGTYSRLRTPHCHASMTCSRRLDGGKWALLISRAQTTSPSQVAEACTACTACRDGHRGTPGRLLASRLVPTDPGHSWSLLWVAALFKLSSELRLSLSHPVPSQVPSRCSREVTVDRRPSCSAR
jgi:hypothetical protein